MQRLENSFLYCTHYNATKDVQTKISGFSVSENGANLGYYLRRVAAYEEKSGLARTYLVYEKETDDLVAYFSLRCGHVLQNINRRLFRTKSFDAIPGIEFANWAIDVNFNNTFKSTVNNMKLGTLIFRDFVMPIVTDAQLLVGARLLYLYALPHDELINYYETSMGFRRLPPTEEKQVHRFSRPRYDNNCIFMFQRL